MRVLRRAGRKRGLRRRRRGPDSYPTSATPPFAPSPRGAPVVATAPIRGHANASPPAAVPRRSGASRNTAHRTCGGSSRAAAGPTTQLSYASETRKTPPPPLGRRLRRKRALGPSRAPRARAASRERHDLDRRADGEAFAGGSQRVRWSAGPGAALFRRRRVRRRPGERRTRQAEERRGEGKDRGAASRFERASAAWSMSARARGNSAAVFPPRVRSDSSRRVRSDVDATRSPSSSPPPASGKVRAGPRGWPPGARRGAHAPWSGSCAGASGTCRVMRCAFVTTARTQVARRRRRRRGRRASRGGAIAGGDHARSRGARSGRFARRCIARSPRRSGARWRFLTSSGTTESGSGSSAPAFVRAAVSSPARRTTPHACNAPRRERANTVTPRSTPTARKSSSDHADALGYLLGISRSTRAPGAIAPSARRPDERPATTRREK